METSVKGSQMLFATLTGHPFPETQSRREDWGPSESIHPSWTSRFTLRVSLFVPSKETGVEVWKVPSESPKTVRVSSCRFYVAV